MNNSLYSINSLSVVSTNSAILARDNVCQKPRYISTKPRIFAFQTKALFTQPQISHDLKRVLPVSPLSRNWPLHSRLPYRKSVYISCLYHQTHIAGFHIWSPQQYYR